MNWEEETFRVSYSSTFDQLGGRAVNVHVLRTSRRKQEWILALRDMAPRVLEWSGFPIRLVRAARLVAEDKRLRIVRR